MTRTIAINLRVGVCCTLHANPGVHAPYNIIDAPPKYRQTAAAVITELKTTKNKNKQ